MTFANEPEARFWPKVRKTYTCWLWTGAIASKYGRFYVGDSKLVQAHRYSYELAYGPVPPGRSVLHHCDVPACVRPDHLFAGTAKDNAQDMIRKGRRRQGNHVLAPNETGQNAKLTAQDIRDIRGLLSMGVGVREIARRYEVNNATISNVKLGKLYKSVT